MTACVRGGDGDASLRDPLGAVTSTRTGTTIFFSRSSTGSYPGRWARARTYPSRAAPGTDDVASHGRGHSDAPHTATDAHASPSRNGAVPPWTRVARHRRSRPPLSPRPATLDDGVARHARRRSPTPRCRRLRRLVPRRESRVPPSRGRLLGRSPSPRRAHPRGGGRRRRHRGGANRWVPFRGHRGQVAEALGGQQDLPHAGTDRHVQAQVLRPRHVPVPQVRRRPTRPPAPRSSSLPNPNPQSPRPLFHLAPFPFAAARVFTWATPRDTPPPTSSRGISA